ncbi:MAG: AEC family transporter [Candidatus Lokiarchaeota archaeon]|nr:AEC family transporter [Candidatus Lokiarchaeota archaeon]
MADLTTLNAQFAISLAIIAIGYLLKRSRVIDKEGGGKALVRIIFNVTLPAIILRTLTRIQMDVAMVAMPFLAFLITGVVLGSAYFIHKGEPSKKQRGQYVMMSLGYNVGNFAFPLIQGVFGDEGLKYAAMFDVGNAMVIFGLCYILAVTYSAKDGERPRAAFVAKKVLTSPPLLSYVIGLVLNGVGFRFPDVVSNLGDTGLIDVIARSNTFITFLALGVYLDFKLDKKYWKDLAKILLTRYGIGLLLGIAFLLLWPVSLMARTILLVCFILPVGMGLLVFVVQFGYDERFAGMLSNIMNVISFGLLWLVFLALGGTGT